jgi:hypothetical protein
MDSRHSQNNVKMANGGSFHKKNAKSKSNNGVAHAMRQHVLETRRGSSVLPLCERERNENTVCFVTSSHAVTTRRAILPVGSNNLTQTARDTCEMHLHWLAVYT